MGTPVGPSQGLLVLFAAQTLKHKLVYDWRQLDEAAVFGLREKLWSMLLPSSQVPKNVAVQLRLALGALIVQIGEKLWVDPVADLFRCAGNVFNDDILQLLTVIPEQLKNPAIRFPSSDAFFGCCERLLERHVDVVIQMLLSRLGSLADSQMALQCLLSWIQYGGNGSKLIESAEFLQGIFTLLKRAVAEAGRGEEEDVDEEELSGLVETCSELLIELCERLSGRLEDDFEVEEGHHAAGHGQSWYDKMNSAWNPVLARELSTLPLQAALNRGFLQRPLVALLAEAAQIFIDQLLHGFPTEFNQICQLLMAVIESPACPITIAELTFPFFSLLPNFLNDWDQEGEVSAEGAFFKQIYSALLRSLLTRHLPFPTTCTPEEVDRFRELRHVIGDTLKDCVRVLGASEALALLAPILVDETVSWQGREAALFALRAISSAVDPRESEVMPQISAQLNRLLAQLLSCQQAIVGVRKPVSAILLNVGCYAEWLRYHADHLPGHLQLIGESLKYALSSTASANHLESPQSIISSACQSLKYVAQSVAGLLGRHYSVLEEIYGICVRAPVLGRLERLDLTEAICLVLIRRSVEDDEFCEALERILQPIWREARWDAYAVALESLLMPELPRTPLIFSRFFLPGLSQLLNSLSGCCEDEGQLEAWLRCLTAALNNGTAGAVEEMIRVVLMPWLRVVVLSNAPQEAMLFALLSTMISGRFLETGDEELFSVALQRLAQPFPTQVSDSWVSERFNLLRVLLLNYPAVPVQPLLEQSFTWVLLQQFLARGRPCSASEISALTGFLAVLISSGADDCKEPLLWSLKELIERVLKDWPIQHCHDLATVLCRASRAGTGVSELMSGCLKGLLTETTEIELKKLATEFEEAVDEAKRGGRGRKMRSIIKDLADLSRRRS